MEWLYLWFVFSNVSLTKKQAYIIRKQLNLTRTCEILKFGTPNGYKSATSFTKHEVAIDNENDSI